MNLKPIFVIACLAATGAWAAPQDDYQQGRRAYLSGDVVTAMAPLKRAADAGHPGAQSLYGFLLGEAGYNQEALQYFKRDFHPSQYYSTAKCVAYIATSPAARAAAR